MNYRRAFHPGNFAHALKHAALALAIEHLKRKPAAFRVIDTHAGSGRYALDAEEATKTAEWQGGIGRLLGTGAAPLPAPVAALLAPLSGRRAGREWRRGVAPRSRQPAHRRRLMRAQDTLAANELNPE